MNCEQCRDVLLAEPVEAAPAAMPPEVRSHLADCPSCREYSDQLAAMAAKLGDYPQLGGRPVSLFELYRAIQGSGRRARALPWVAAVAACLFAVIGASLVLTALEVHRLDGQVAQLRGQLADAKASTRDRFVEVRQEGRKDMMAVAEGMVSDIVLRQAEYERSLRGDTQASIKQIRDSLDRLKKSIHPVSDTQP